MYVPNLNCRLTVIVCLIFTVDYFNVKRNLVFYNEHDYLTIKKGTTKYNMVVVQQVQYDIILQNGF